MYFEMLKCPSISGKNNGVMFNICNYFAKCPVIHAQLQLTVPSWQSNITSGASIANSSTNCYKIVRLNSLTLYNQSLILHPGSAPTGKRLH